MMIDDPVVTEYVKRVGQNLVRNSDAKVPFTIGFAEKWIKCITQLA